MTEDHRPIKSAKSARDGNVSEAGIPEDVWLDAIAALDGHGELRIIEVIARAILAERESCAKIAEDRAVEYDNSYETSEFKSQALAGAAALHVIADAIRRR